MNRGVRLQAHRGVEHEYPGNTMESFRAAVEQGYEMIELDLAVTKDGKIIVLHDDVINTTARHPDGRKIIRKINIADITYEEALGYDFGIAFSEKFRGVKLPLFSDVLKLAADNGIQLKIDNKLRRFTPEQLEMFFEMVKNSGASVIISCWSDDTPALVVEKLPGAEISFDGLTDENKLSRFSSLVGKDHFSVWLPVDYSMAKWAPSDWFATPGKCAIIEKYAKVAIWAIESPESFNRAADMYHPWAAETTGTIKPEGYKA